MTVHMYKWTDVDAPVLNSDGPGAMANLLRKCLVDGYGSGSEEKAPAGWTMDWDTETNARLALLPAAEEAQECHYYVDDTGTIGAGGNRWARIWMSEDWQGWDGTTGEPVDTLIPDDTEFGRTIAKNVTDADATAVPWILIATASAFYWLVDYYDNDPDFEGTRPPAMGFCGRAVAYGGADDYLDVVSFSGYEDYTGSISSYLGVMGSPRRWSEGDAPHVALARRSYDGVSVNDGIGTRIGAGGTDNEYSYIGYRPNTPHPDPVTGGTLVARALITAGSPSTTTSLIRGHYPGLLSPLHDTPFAMEEIVAVEGRQHMAINLSVSGSTKGQALIDIDGPWE